MRQVQGKKSRNVKKYGKFQDFSSEKIKRVWNPLSFFGGLQGMSFEIPEYVSVFDV